MRYTYDAIMTREDDGYVVSFPQFDGCVTAGDTRADALRNAADALSLAVAGALEDGEGLPPSRRVAEVLSVSVEVTRDDMDAMRCMTMSQAAEELGVTAGRVSQLVKAGALDVVEVGGRRLVTIDSVNARNANPPAAHRPARAAALA